MSPGIPSIIILIAESRKCIDYGLKTSLQVYQQEGWKNSSRKDNNLTPSGGGGGGGSLAVVLDF